MRKIVQIAVTESDDGTSLYALDREGDVWYYSPGHGYYEGEWYRLPPLPENDVKF